MTTFIMFGRYSMEAVKAMSAKRTEKAAALVKELGGEIKAGYALLGKTDLLLIADFPGNNEAMKASVELSKLLGIGFETAPAITVDEFDKLVSD
jgi:uncharacterized protein with GYD domain